MFSWLYLLPTPCPLKDTWQEQDGLQGVFVCSCIHRSSSLGLSPKTSTLGGHQCAPSRVLVHGSTRAYPSPSAHPAAPGESCLWAVCHQCRISHRSADVTQDSGLALPSRDFAFSSFFLMRTSPTLCSLLLLSFYSVIRIDIVDRKF